MSRDRVETWLEALEARHLANLTRPELTRAVRALSSCYVERRERLASGGPLDSAGKRAAFALFYGALHFLTIDRIVRALDGEPRSSRVRSTVLDIGCGTGVAGAAVSIAMGSDARVAGFDRNPWAVEEANWTYRQLAVAGRARTADAQRSTVRVPRDTTIVLGYVVNELPEPAKADVLAQVETAVQQGAGLILIEPIARRGREWWPAWQARLAPMGGIEREWRFQADLPALVRSIARGAGLDLRELTARTLTVP
jgi:SAM-dependent methyltransferase